MRFLEQLNRPSTVMIVLGIVIAVNGFLLYRYLATPHLDSGGSEQGEVTTSNTTEERSATSQMSEADYLTKVGDIQNGAVETFAGSNDKLLRYDALTSKDIADLQANYFILEEYSNQIKYLNPPEKYKGQYALFGSGINELYNATEIAYRLAAKPVSATKADFEAYERHVDRATASLEQSNETLGQNYETTEGIRLPTRTI